MATDEEVWSGSAEEPDPKEDWYLPDGAAKQCAAKSKASGKRCKKAPILGGTVCRLHGGAAPQVKAKAAERLLAMIDPALVELGKILQKSDATDADRLRAINSILDRAGVRAGMEVELTVPAWQEMLQDLFSGKYDEPEPAKELAAGPPETKAEESARIKEFLAGLDRDHEPEPYREPEPRPVVIDAEPVSGVIVRPRSPHDPREQVKRRR